MLTHRSACLAVAVTLIAGGAVAQRMPNMELARCTLAASPTTEALCEPQVVSLGVNGAEIAPDGHFGIPEPSEVAMFGLNSVTIISPEEQVVVLFPEAGADVASANEVVPDRDVEETGSITPSEPQQ